MTKDELDIVNELIRKEKILAGQMGLILCDGAQFVTCTGVGKEVHQHLSKDIQKQMKNMMLNDLQTQRNKLQHEILKTVTMEFSQKDTWVE